MNDPAMCAHCEQRPATCVGKYGGDDAPSPACDVCCGHGCEDGRCEPIEVIRD